MVGRCTGFFGHIRKKKLETSLFLDGPILEAWWREKKGKNCTSQSRQFFFLFLPVLV